jgi:hypothetical protein
MSRSESDDVEQIRITVVVAGGGDPVPTASFGSGLVSSGSAPTRFIRVGRLSYRSVALGNW